MRGPLPARLEQRSGIAAASVMSSWEGQASSEIIQVRVSPGRVFELDLSFYTAFKQHILRRLREQDLTVVHLMSGAILVLDRSLLRNRDDMERWSVFVSNLRLCMHSVSPSPTSDERDAYLS